MDPKSLVRVAIYSGTDPADIEYRASGIFGHPNGAAGCILIAIPILIGMVEERRLPRSALWLGVGIEALVFYFTKSRGSLLVSAGLLAYWLLVCAPPLYRVPSAILMAIAGVLLLGALSHLDFTQSVWLRRFADTEAISTNASDRWWTITTAFDLVLRHPFGIGSSYGALLAEATGTDAAHNAFLELALLGGLPLAIFVAARLIGAASLLVTPYRPMEFWLAAYFIGIFLFETYFVQVNIPILTIWVLWFPRRAVAEAEVEPQIPRGMTPAWQPAGGDAPEFGVMKIHLIAPSLAGGGAESVLLETASMLFAAGHAVTVVTLEGEEFRRLYLCRPHRPRCLRATGALSQQMRRHPQQSREHAANPELRSSASTGCRNLLPDAHERPMPLSASRTPRSHHRHRA